MITGNFFAAYEAAGYTFTDPDGDTIFAQIVSTASGGAPITIGDAGATISFSSQGANLATFKVFPNGDFEFNAANTAENVDAGTVLTLTAWIGIGDRKNAAGAPDTAQDGPRLPLAFAVAGTRGVNSDPFVTAPTGAPVPTITV